MIPIAQRHLWRPADDPAGPQQGDCAAACVASIFELPYEQCAHIEGHFRSIGEWTKARFQHSLILESRMLGDGWKGVEDVGDHVNWPRKHHIDGFWMASVWSPRVPDVERFGCGCADLIPGGDPDCRWCAGEPESRSMGIDWGLHAVVMRDSRLVWDPHPMSDPGEVLYFRGTFRWVLLDPSRVMPQATEAA